MYDDFTEGMNDNFIVHVERWKLQKSLVQGKRYVLVQYLQMFSLIVTNNSRKNRKYDQHKKFTTKPTPTIFQKIYLRHKNV